MAAAVAAEAFRQQQQEQQQQEGEDEGVVVLRCFDGVKVPAPASLARQRSGLVVDQAAGGERVVDVPGHIPGRVVARVVAYWEARKAADTGFDGEFLGGLRHDARVDLIHAAYHLRDAALFDLFRFGALA